MSINWKQAWELGWRLYVGYLLIGLILFILERVLRVIHLQWTYSLTGVVVVGAIGGILSLILLPLLLGSHFSVDKIHALVASAIAIVGNVLVWSAITPVVMQLLNSNVDILAAVIGRVFGPTATSSFVTTFCSQQIYNWGIGGNSFCFFNALWGIPTILITIGVTTGFLLWGAHLKKKK